MMEVQSRIIWDLELQSQTGFIDQTIGWFFGPFMRQMLHGAWLDDLVQLVAKDPGPTTNFPSVHFTMPQSDQLFTDSLLPLKGVEIAVPLESLQNALYVIFSILDKRPLFAFMGICY
jgi:hypothetical protein